jgi:hypothetical protein
LGRKTSGASVKFENPKSNSRQQLNILSSKVVKARVQIISNSKEISIHEERPPSTELNKDLNSLVSREVA